jgi:lysozyme
MTRSRASLAALALATLAACSGAPGTSGSGGEDLGSSSAAVTVCAGGSTVKGVDVSTYQGSIDWASVKASGRDFAITRVSDGTGTLDNTFAANWSGIKAAGMVRGVYQFFRASEDPTAQADLLVSKVGTLDPGDLPPVADVEVSDGVSGATLVANLATWVSVIKAKTGRTPMIYSAPGFWDGLPAGSQFAGEVLWVANWGVSCPDTPSGWSKWSFWQDADNGSVPGISGAVDTDVFNGTLAQLQAFGGPAPYAAQYVSQSFPLASTALTMTQGETVASYIELKNVGSKTWDSNTKIGTTQPRDRSSAFADSSWLAPNRLAAVSGTVPPGSTYKFQFNLHAPVKEGTYDEYFGVVEEGVAWFSDPGQGGPVDNDLEVQVKVVAAPPGVDAGSPTVPGDDGGANGTGGGGAGAGGGSGGAGSSGGTTDPTPPVLGSEDGGSAAGANGESGGTFASGAGGSGGCSVGASRPADGTMWVAVAGVILALGAARRRMAAASAGTRR